MTSILATNIDLKNLANRALASCSIPWQLDTGSVTVRTPITGSILGKVPYHQVDLDETTKIATNVFKIWRSIPAPQRGAVIRNLGNLLITNKVALANLIQIEVGKIRSEALGEIQEMIDICEFAVGQSRQLYGRTIASERPDHTLSESWLPAGPVGIISAFNFPAAVWAWNAALAIVCGDPVIWKPSELTPLTSLAINHLARQAAKAANAPEDLFQIVLGGADLGAKMSASPQLPIISATGSTSMGHKVALATASRFAKSILELGGNNAAIVTPTANLDLAIRAITFSAVGTAGQRCTTLRRLIVANPIYDELCERLIATYASLTIGDPRKTETLVGPLINMTAAINMEAAVEQSNFDGCQLLTPVNRLLSGLYPQAAYYSPLLVAMPKQTEIVRKETFAPILYIMKYDDLDEAIAIHNDVPQGLSSSIFTTDIQDSARFLGPSGSDCGIANVNIGPSGAEIGGAFGGEKETGGGRESGSDAWKGYMRRATNTVCYSDTPLLAQGVTFI
jgi:aldehyde dehydrogenase (NAD+)